ncbi:hypothetical protein [Flavobacterium terrisoli]|uniref:hypothetical protein n=1 Tax=Flavobacterium terrisoli TaxID=3242195 RepID=UPI00254296AA|nr:hypothetical protein [Flavobacterium buctense]
MKITFLLLLLLSFETCFSQKKDEQIAADYFFENILKKEELKYRKIKFSGSTEKQTSGLIFNASCLNNEENITIQSNGFAETEEAIKLNTENRKFGSGKSKLSMHIYQSFELTPKKKVVVIYLLEKHEHIWYYVLIISDLKIIDWCKITAII